ncbi:MAG: hypothetical protein ACLR1V_00990 [Coprococcus sp.]
MIAAMTAGVCPTTAFAVTEGQVAADGTYTATAHVTRTAEDDENYNEWHEYDVEVSLTVVDGKFTDITVTPASGYDSENDSYFNKAYNNEKKVSRHYLKAKKQLLIQSIAGILFPVQHVHPRL